MQIPGLRGLSPGTVLTRATREFLDDDMSTYAAALAYQVLFALFPFIIFLIALLGFLGVPEFFDWLLEQAALVLPTQALTQVENVVGEVRTPSGGLLSLGIILAIWAASGGVRATMNALNVAYDVAETRPAWKLFPLSILYTIGLAMMLILAAGLMVIGPQVMTWLADWIGMGNYVVLLWTWLRWPIAVLLMLLAVTLTYYLAPNVKQRFRLITPGAVLALAIWVLASLVFTYYIGAFANYSATYGSIGAVIVLLLYFYLTSAVLLFGAEVNATIERLGQ